MLIGIDASRALRTQATGTERYARAIIYHLLALPTAQAHRWRLYADRAPTPMQLAQLIPPEQPDVDLRVLPAQRLWTHRALARSVIRRPPDVLFVPAHVIPFVLPAHRLPPSVVTIHDLGYHYFPAAHARMQRIYLRLSTAWSVRSARRIIAVSHATAADVERFHPGVSDKIRVVHEAADVMTDAQCAATASTAHQVLTRFGLDRPYALYIGTIQPRKNLLRVIDAYARLCNQRPLSWQLALVGAQGWLSQALYARAQAQGLDERVRFLGYVSDDNLPALLQGATFFCFPSLFEGFGLPVLEAQSYGVPVMTSNNSSLPEVAGDAALLVDPTDVDAIADAMLRLSQDETLRQRLIRAGYENVKRFSWTKAAAETLAVLEEAAQSDKVVA